MFKSLFLVVSLALTFSAFAADITVLETDGARFRSSDDFSTKFVVDQSTGEGSVKLTVSRTHYRHGRNGETYETTRTLHTQEAKIAGLYLQGDKFVFHSDTEEVECATFGVSRVFKIPTLYLSGKCDVAVKRVRGLVKVQFTTK